MSRSEHDDRPRPLGGEGWVACQHHLVDHLFLAPRGERSEEGTPAQMGEDLSYLGLKTTITPKTSVGRKVRSIQFTVSRLKSSDIQ
jgi:hypothetical protein